MSTSITIPTELEAKIAERAAMQGKDVEQFALEALSRAVEMPPLRDLFADVREGMHIGGVSEVETRREN